MHSITKIAGGALAVVLVTTTLAVAAGGGQTNGNRVVQQADTGITIALKRATCKVAGSPSEFPDDIWFTNNGTVVLPAGTKINWKLAGYNNSKNHTLVADLAPGAGVYALNANPGGTEAGHGCKAKVL